MVVANDEKVTDGNTIAADVRSGSRARDALILALVDDVISAMAQKVFVAFADGSDDDDEEQTEQAGPGRDGGDGGNGGEDDDEQEVNGSGLAELLVKHLGHEGQQRVFAGADGVVREVPGGVAGRLVEQHGRVAFSVLGFSRQSRPEPPQRLFLEPFVPFLFLWCCWRDGFVS